MIKNIELENIVFVAELLYLIWQHSGDPCSLAFAFRWLYVQEVGFAENSQSGRTGFHSFIIAKGSLYVFLEHTFSSWLMVNVPLLQLIDMPALLTSR